MTVEKPSTPPVRWRDMLLGTSPTVHRMRRFFRRLPSDPRCAMCYSPQGGIGGRFMQLIGYGRYPRNPQLCQQCFRAWEHEATGAEVEITAMFVDVRGSTGLAETMSPSAYSEAVSTYVRTSTRAVRANGGIVEKLLGDGVMATFIPGFVSGIPQFEDGGHARAAVLAARSLLAAVTLPVGIGIHTGEAWLGFVEVADDVRDFTALGDAINVASRLGSEAAAGEILMSAATVTSGRLATAGLAHRTLELRGRSEPLEAWSEHVEPAAATAA